MFSIMGPGTNKTPYNGDSMNFDFIIIESAEKCLKKVLRKRKKEKKIKKFDF